jgi:hypothetical protein
MRLLLLMSVNSSICCAYLTTVGIRVSTGNFRDFLLFTAGSSSKTSPSARYASAVDTVCKNTNVFNHLKPKLC